GARELEFAAKELETSALMNPDRSVLESLVKRVDEATGIVLDSISELESANGTGPVRDTAAEALDENLFGEVLNELAEALRRADPEEINRILLSLKGSAPWKRHPEVERLIKQYDYDEALEALTQWINDRQKGNLKG
ncbi:MAG: hypothetical protein R6U27_11640, partial [Desulfobacterales bacterium]